MNSNKSKTSCKRGFTLIELLVVVLIIGILAAVALPQYKVAVVKSRAAALLPLSKALWDAQELYYVREGIYATTVEDLDIEVPSSCTEWNVPGFEQHLHCGDFWLNTGADKGRCSIMYCPGVNDPVECRSKRDFQLSMYGKHGGRPDQRICWVENDSSLGKKVCSSFGGFELGE